jgi:hypothetical protein
MYYSHAMLGSGAAYAQCMMDMGQYFRAGFDKSKAASI